METPASQIANIMRNPIRESVGRNTKYRILNTILKSLPALLYTALIFYMSSRSWPEAPEIRHIDKVIHFFEYGILSILLCLPLGKKNWLAAAIIATLYGLIDEAHQYFVPGRNAAMGDAIADCLGAFTSSYLWCKFVVRRK